MLRPLSLALFVLAIGLAVACGRQVTPSPSTSGSLAGTVQIKFSVAGPIDFSQFNYYIVFNTSGQGGEPYAPQLALGNYRNFSYAFLVGAATGGNGTILPVLLQFYFVPATGQFRFQQFNVNPSLTSLQPNSNGQGTQFTVTFARSQLALPPPTAPTPTPTAIGTSTPTPAPTPTPTGGGTSAPTPVSSPTVAAQSTWYVNLFVLDNTNKCLDALGPTGCQDQSFTQGSFSVNDSVDTVYNQPAELNPPPNPASQISTLEIVNYP